MLGGDIAGKPMQVCPQNCCVLGLKPLPKESRENPSKDIAAARRGHSRIAGRVDKHGSVGSCDYRRRSLQDEFDPPFLRMRESYS